MEFNIDNILQMRDSQDSPANLHLHNNRDLHLKRYIVLYDATCRLCRSTIKFLRSKSKSNALEFYALQSEMATIIFKYYISVPACDSVILIKKSASNKWEYFTKSDAVFRCAGLLSFPWSLFKLLLILPGSIRDFFYEFLARYRFNIFGKTIDCDLCHR